jgi:hypothetical protein
MASGKFYKINIDDIWLTSTALVNGIQCFLTVIGANEFFTQIAGSVIDTVGGRVVQFVPYTKNKDFEIQVSIMPADIWDDLVALREELLTNNESVNIVGTARPGNFDVQAKPRPDEMFSFGEFDNDFIYNVSMKFYSV